MTAGLFDSFDNLDQISVENIAAWLKPIPQFNRLENYLANRILYPQTLPQTEIDMQIDLSILREALKLNSSKIDVLNIHARKLLIPSEFLNFAPDLISLTNVFVDAFLLGRKKKDLLEDLWTIILTGDANEIAGSVMLPQFAAGGVMKLNVLGKNYELRQGGLMVIPCFQDRCEMAYKLQNGSVLGKAESAIEICGGKLGIVIDGRNV